MTVSVLKMRFRKLPPRIISYKDISNYHNANFINTLTEILFEGENMESFVKDPDWFCNVCTEVLNQYVPCKKKYVRGNNKRFMSKALSKAITQRPKLRNKFLKDSSAENKFSYNMQRNWCVSLSRKQKKKIFFQFKQERYYSQQKIWQTIKPFLSEKTKLKKKFTLIEDENLVSDDAEVANCVNNFFSEIVQNLEIPKYGAEDDSHVNMNSHPTFKAVFKYKNYPSIISIRRFRHQVSNFHFSCIDKNTIAKEIRGLRTTKASQDNDLPAKILKENADYFAEFICIQFNNSVNSSKFQSSFKCANITPIFKNESGNHKTNYRPVII